MNDANRVGACILPTQRRLLPYNGDSIKLVGAANINVSYNNVRLCHKFFIVSGNKINLLGRDLIHKLNIQFVFPDPVNAVKDVLDEFDEYLSDSYKSNVTETVHLDMPPNVIPVYAKERPVPFKLRDKVTAELHRLSSEGKIVKIFYSQWASPVVTVFKHDSSLRLCGDFSATVNKYLKPVYTPLPTTDDTIARIGKATVFPKLICPMHFCSYP